MFKANKSIKNKNVVNVHFHKLKKTRHDNNETHKTSGMSTCTSNNTPPTSALAAHAGATPAQLVFPSLGTNSLDSTTAPTPIKKSSSYVQQ